MLPNEKLCVGTAQFGMHYGVTNKTGVVSSQQITTILEMSKSEKIRFVDTAAAYGECEQLLGKNDLSGFQIITKLKPLPNNIGGDNENYLFRQFKNSLRFLNQKSIHAVLVHNPMDFLGKHGDSLFVFLSKLKFNGYIEKVGCSVYSPSEAEEISKRYDIDIIQGPFNVFDQRLANSGVLKSLQQHKIEFHARSIFLQGLLLGPISRIPESHLQWRDIFVEWFEWCASNRASAMEACFSTVYKNPAVSKVIIGVQSPQQFREVLACRKNLDVPNFTPQMMICNDLIDPRLW